MTNNRLKRLRESLGENDIDAVLISQPENRRYISGFSGSAGFLLVNSSKAVLATDFRYTEQALSQAPDFEILRIASSIADWFPDLLRGNCVKRLGFESEDVTYDLYGKLKDTVDKKQLGLELVPVSMLVEKLREVKEKDEIACITMAVEIADKAYEQVAAVIEAGMTEKQVAWDLEKALRENGSESIPFEIIVASGPNSALPHAQPTERTIREGDAIVIDMGARYRGYVSDLSRTLCIGTPGDTFRKVYNTVLDAQMSAMAMIKEGTTGHNADNAARNVISKAGYGEAFGHALGHGVGLAPHEMPRLGQGADKPLTAGMVFTVEPGIYLTGWGGVRIEDTVTIVDGNAKAITKARKVTYD